MNVIATAATLPGMEAAQTVRRTTGARTDSARDQSFGGLLEVTSMPVTGAASSSARATELLPFVLDNAPAHSGREPAAKPLEAEKIDPAPPDATMAPVATLGPQSLGLSAIAVSGHCNARNSNIPASSGQMSEKKRTSSIVASIAIATKGPTQTDEQTFAHATPGIAAAAPNGSRISGLHALRTETYLLAGATKQMVSGNDYPDSPEITATPDRAGDVRETATAMTMAPVPVDGAGELHARGKANAREADATGELLVAGSTRLERSQLENDVGSNDTHPVIAQIATQIVGGWLDRAEIEAGVAKPAAPGPSALASQALLAVPDVIRTLRFALHPGELGEVQVRLSLERNEVRVHLSFTEGRAADIARADHQALAHALTESGITMAGLVIDTSHGASSGSDRPEGQASDFQSAAGSLPDGRGTGRDSDAHGQNARRQAVPTERVRKAETLEATKSGVFV